ncbi:hypothetical protein C0Z19_13010 [Trinickia soli]|uniref:Uncharacterized protein n=1 Tax=Trinickia soli TaxID=380675 RepID=A0A2N7W5Q7_9BURK|nr:hypothetical protein CIW54_04465 [Paraburkholderia sp. T12-10]PMS24723.1 hypothetical protein C0Z19_13010 [Trinickia soli]
MAEQSREPHGRMRTRLQITALHGARYPSARVARAASVASFDAGARPGKPRRVWRREARCMLDRRAACLANF